MQPNDPNAQWSQPPQPTQPVPAQPPLPTPYQQPMPPQQYQPALPPSPVEQPPATQPYGSALPPSPIEQPAANPYDPTASQPIAPPQPSFTHSQTPSTHPMVVLQPGEQVVATLKRHPIGIVSVYVGAAMGLLVAAGLAFFLVPHLAAQYNVAGDVLHIVYGVFGFLAVGMLLMVAVSSNVYWQNEWVVTTDSITEITQKSLLGRQVSELSMEHIEDVTVDQSGVLQHMFNFGTLKVETAGERSKFVFPYCPNPNQSARVILEARERFTNGHEGH